MEIIGRLVGMLGPFHGGNSDLGTETQIDLC
jgi:hypothetical protein